MSSNHPNKKLFFVKCFTLHVMNLKYMNISLFEISKEKINFFTIFTFFLDVTVYTHTHTNTHARTHTHTHTLVHRIAHIGLGVKSF